MHYHEPTNSLRNLPKTHGCTTDFPAAGEKAHRAAGFFPVKDTVIIEGDAASVQYDYDTGIATVTRVPKHLDSVKAAAINANREECQRRIESRWPAFAQLDIAIGVYTDPAMMADCQEWIASHIMAENAAADQINAAETAETVNAVIVEWPNETEPQI